MHHRRRFEAPGREHRSHPGAAHLGLGADAPPARARHCSRRRSVAGRRALDRVPPGVLPVRACAVAPVPAPLPRSSRRSTGKGGCSSSASTLRWPTPASPDGSRRFASARGRLCQAPVADPSRAGYLSRHTQRVAIANSRLVAIDEHGVTFGWKDLRDLFVKSL